MSSSSIVSISTHTTTTSTSIPVPTPAPKRRGGFAQNPFGGFDRLDRIDLFDYASGSDDPSRLLFLATIQQAASEFLFYDLGRNGTTAEEFWFSTEYFFRVRSHFNDVTRTMKQTFIDEETGIRTSRTITLSDDEISLGCFDRHYELAGLNRVMPMNLFLSMLSDQRLSILAENWNQVRNYLNRPAVDDYELLHALVEPNDPEEFAIVLYGKSRALPLAA